MHSRKSISVIIAVAMVTLLTTISANPRMSIIHPKGGVSRVSFKFGGSSATRLSNYLTPSPIRYIKIPSRSRPFRRFKPKKTSSWMSPIRFLDLPYVSNARPVRPYNLTKKKVYKPRKVVRPYKFSSIAGHIRNSNIVNLPFRMVSNGRPYSVYRYRG
ncbi:Uncharacterised protein r2_g3106 [Pycnogonum litorale]